MKMAHALSAALTTVLLVPVGLGAQVKFPSPLPVPSIPVTITGSTAPVAVTNPPGAPLKTTDAFPRTPVRLEVTGGNSYVVPAGSRLVVETLSFFLNCPIGTAMASGFLNDNSAAPRLPFALPLVSTDTLNRFGTTQSLRIVLEPADQLSATGTCGSLFTSPSFTLITVYGYLISMDSPSLAP